MASHYKIRAEDWIYAEEFRANPQGHHSPGLQRVLTLFRSAPLKGKHVLIETKPYKEWRLARHPGERGKPVTLLDKVYRDPKDAEWEIFKLRWKAHTGEDLD